MDYLKFSADNLADSRGANEFPVLVKSKLTSINTDSKNTVLLETTENRR